MLECVIGGGNCVPCVPHRAPGSAPKNKMGYFRAPGSAPKTRWGHRQGLVAFRRLPIHLKDIPYIQGGPTIPYIM